MEQKNNFFNFLDSHEKSTKYLILFSVSKL